MSILIILYTLPFNSVFHCTLGFPFSFLTQHIICLLNKLIKKITHLRHIKHVTDNDSASNLIEYKSLLLIGNTKSQRPSKHER